MEKFDQESILRIFESIKRRLRLIENAVGVERPLVPISEGVPSLAGNHWKHSAAAAQSDTAHLTRCVMDLREHVLKLEDILAPMYAVFERGANKRSSRRNG